MNSLYTIPRLVPSNGVNPNNKRPYLNLQQKLSEYLKVELDEGYVPLYKHTKDIDLDANNIIGRVVSVTEDAAIVEIRDIDYLHSLKCPAISINTLIEKWKYTDTHLVVERILSISLAENYKKENAK